MLVSQWRECIAIKRQWEKGTLKHRLVSYVMDYSKDTFCQYVEKVVEELNNRGIKYQNKFINEFIEFGKNDGYGLAVCKRYKEHNDRYFKQCYYNLEEKHDRGIISDEEWKPINDLKEVENVENN